MTEFSVRVHGLEAVEEAFEYLPENIEPAITRALIKTAAEAVEMILSLISDSFPPPSLPFEPPHVRSGDLRRSVRIESVEPLRVTMAVGGAGTGVSYAAWLEFGTQDMEPRPFVAPVIERISAEAITNLIIEEINADLENAIHG